MGWARGHDRIGLPWFVVFSYHGVLREAGKEKGRGTREGSVPCLLPEVRVAGDGVGGQWGSVTVACEER